MVSEILKPESQKQRVDVLAHFIDIAERCRVLNNFNACMEIISGLGDSSIHRLRTHWQELPKKYQTIYDELKTILSSDQSYKSFRAYIKTCQGACIPYLGMYLTDLTFIEDGNNDKIGDLFNFTKRIFVSNVIQEILYYQQSPYVLETVPAIQNYLGTLEDKTLDKEACYQRSLQIIPRGGAAAPAAASPGSLPQKKPDDEYGELEDYPGYAFFEKDSKANIRLQESDSGTKVTAGTLEKIVERVCFFPPLRFLALSSFLF